MKVFIQQLRFYQNKQVHQELTERKNSEKYKKSGLTPEKAEYIKELIFEAFEKEQLHRNNRLDLNQLAETIKQDRYKISEVLNSYCSKNFYAFLNEYRIRDAKSLLAQNPFVSVKSVMYEVGFNSKNSFYTAFKKDTGLSPNEFRNLARYQYSTQVA
ncbi:helix-turn-helix domain-containing protein [Croceivirga thetidis]|uniref:AraC family transcriptional regulator n=1 Tax=Croceivirga thetidis TaxID=2721623 RepID=A0ABX1GSS6_9FLAO|nr:helix-turn-helix domain-containing protein [Croceivirga thetidis]NKI33008.1 AraC family transcriptional regulator [Croceivirga thetidis]